MSNLPFEEFCLPMDGTEFPVIRFGTGERNLLILMGMSLHGITGQGAAMAQKFRLFADDYTVTVLDRKKLLPEGTAIRDMAEDVFHAAAMLGIGSADVYGISQGGMIAQIYAAEHPEAVHALVLCATAYHVSPEMSETVSTWIRLADAGDVTALNTDCFGRIFSPALLKKYEKALKVLAGRGNAEECRRFATLGRACMDFNTEAMLKNIRCPVLVIAGEEDRVLGAEDSRVLARQTGGQLLMIPGYGHSVYDEAPNVKERIYEFLSCHI